MVTTKNGIQITKWTSGSVGIFDKSKGANGKERLRESVLVPYAVDLKGLELTGPGIAPGQGRGRTISPV